MARRAASVRIGILLLVVASAYVANSLDLTHRTCGPGPAIGVRPLLPNRPAFRATGDVPVFLRSHAFDSYDGVSWGSLDDDVLEWDRLRPVGELQGHRSPGARVLELRITALIEAGIVHPYRTTRVRAPHDAFLWIEPSTGSVAGIIGARCEYRLEYEQPHTERELMEESRLAPRYVERYVMPASTFRSPRVMTIVLEARRLRPWEAVLHVRDRVAERATIKEGDFRPFPITAVEKVLRGKPARPFELLTTTALIARAAQLPVRLGKGYVNPSPGTRSVTFYERDQAFWLEQYVEGKGWVPVPGTAVCGVANVSQARCDQL